MSKAEQKEHDRLVKLWYEKRATTKQMRRCLELDRKAFAEWPSDVAKVAP